MDRASWRKPTSADEVARRNAGRRALHARVRQERERRMRWLLENYPLIDVLPKRGQITEAAELLGVCTRTISRYCRILRERGYAELWDEPTSADEAARKAALHWKLFHR